MRKLIVFCFASMLFIGIGNNNAFANTQDEIQSVAKQYIGVPYRYGGTTTNGFDCSGYVQYVFNKIGIDLPRTTSGQYNVGQAVSKSNLQVGDLVFFNTSGSGVSHVGIYIGNSKFINAATSTGVSIASVNDPYYWSSRYLGARRVIKEEVLPDLPAGQYYDVPTTHWAYTPITNLSKQGVVSGYEHSQFKPEKSISRAEAAVMIINALDLDSTGPISYNDVPANHWAINAIKTADNVGIFSGYENGTFRPDSPITRDEIAALFSKAFELKNAKFDEQVFKDVSESYWAYQSIHLLAENKIASGFADQTYRPKQETTRAEFAAFLTRALDSLQVKTQLYK